MKLINKQILWLLPILILCSASYAQPDSFISIKQKTEVLTNKNKLTTEIDLFFDKNKQTLTKYYHSSPDFVMITNSLGEIKTYYPGKNEVDYKQISELSSKRSLIYYFANNLTDHLGLADEGFNLESSNFEDQYYITNWRPPSYLNNRLTNVKMVFENGMPVYSEYQQNNEEVLKKIYYTNYKDFVQFRLPEKIIEISYNPAGDSIISRTVFSDVNVSPVADNSYFNFKIPENAKPVSTEKNK
ncbi:MAG TPA: hypothetical protein VJ919_07950 [Tangfeifania sp.]|nr:hypothetical protein [Tangfeifania sp.]